MNAEMRTGEVRVSDDDTEAAGEEIIPPAGIYVEQLILPFLPWLGVAG